MVAPLRGNDYELRDLADRAPNLIEATTGAPTGITITRCLGAGGNSTVFLAECDPKQRSEDLSPLTPRRLAVKIMQPRSARTLLRGGVDPASVFVRESVALGRMMERRPPSEFIVGFYGSGSVEVEIGHGDLHSLPWLAIEFVDGGKPGSSLLQRVRQAGGVDPIRAVRLSSGLIEGVSALHEQGILHRDLKPDNVLVAGPIDNEMVKLVDCGIARIEGLASTVQGMTVTYGGPEQTLSRPGESCPVIGPWTDVHALAATVWFVLAGEDWCRGTKDLDWFRGIRRSLATAKRLHPALREYPEGIALFDQILSRGAGQRLPDAAWNRVEAATYKDAAQALLPGMFRGPERFARVQEFADVLLPALRDLADRWTQIAIEEDLAPTAFRISYPVESERLGGRLKLATVRPFAAMSQSEIDRSQWLDPILGGGTSSFAFRPDGKVLARFADRLFYLDFVDDTPHAVGVPSRRIALVGASSWIVGGPGGGFALIGDSHVLLLRNGAFQAMALPERPGHEQGSGGSVGPIRAVIEDGAAFGLVTGGGDSAELWISSDGVGYSAPIRLPLDGEVASVAHGPHGYVVVGAKEETHARAISVGFDGKVHAFTAGVQDRPPLFVAATGAGGSAWAAGEGFVLSLDRDEVSSEAIDVGERPIAMKLDFVGVPWLLTSHSLLRRHIEQGKAIWKAYHRVDSDLPAFAAFGFTPSGACIFDRYGDGFIVTPFDVEDWSQVETWIQDSSKG
jgi:eukaryotic-like serine/threonine-protein kinase